jgi:hypothetical protein
MDFGIVTACCSKDYFLVKATCESIVHFMPKVPICVIVDGEFSISELENLYGVIPLYINQIKSLELREACQKSGRSKLAAFWEGPFEKFLYLDSDAIVWGNLLNSIEWRNSDFIIFTRQLPNSLSKKDLSNYFFNVDLLAKVDPAFRWENHPYFCSGSYCSRRNSIDLQDFLRINKLRQEYPNLFWGNDQGMLNYLVFKSGSIGTLKYSVQDLQYIPVDHNVAANKNLFPVSLNKLPKKVEKEAVIHFCGYKPLIQNAIMKQGKVYFLPFTAFRLAHYQRIYRSRIIPLPYFFAWWQIILEEFKVFLPRIKHKINVFFSHNTYF